MTELTAVITINIHNCNVPVNMRTAASKLIRPAATSATIIVCLRSWRSAHAPAIGAPNTIGTAPAIPMAERAKASSAFCSGCGYNVCVTQITLAKKVSAVPMTDTDCDTHAARKVLNPFGGGSYVSTADNNDPFQKDIMQGVPRNISEII